MIWRETPSQEKKPKQIIFFRLTDRLPEAEVSEQLCTHPQPEGGRVAPAAWERREQEPWRGTAPRPTEHPGCLPGAGSSSTAGRQEPQWVYQFHQEF